MTFTSIRAPRSSLDLTPAGLGAPSAVPRPRERDLSAPELQSFVEELAELRAADSQP